MPNNYFTISWNVNEACNKYYLFSQEPMEDEDFEFLCRNLIPEAGKQVIQKYKGHGVNVGWVEIVEELCNILIEKYKFRRFSPKSVMFRGNWIISDGYPPKKDDYLLGDIRHELARFNDNAIYEQAVS